MSLPKLNIDQKVIDLRVRGNQWDQLQRALDDIVLNRDYPLDVPEILKCLTQSLTNRMAPLDDFCNEMENLQMGVNVLEQVQCGVNLNYETDNLTHRSAALKNLKVLVLKVAQ